MRASEQLNLDQIHVRAHGKEGADGGNFLTNILHFPHLTRVTRWKFSNEINALAPGQQTLTRLEIRYTVYRIEGSNPSCSASPSPPLQTLVCGGFSFPGVRRRPRRGPGSVDPSPGNG